MIEKLELINKILGTYWGIIVFIFTVAALKFGIMMERNYWITRSKNAHRTAINVKGKYYYVITEKEYCEKFLGIKKKD